MSEHRQDAERLAELHYIAMGMTLLDVERPLWNNLMPKERAPLVGAMEALLLLGHIKMGDEE